MPRGERTPCWLIGTAAARVTTIYQRARRQIYRLTAPSDRSAACTLAGASTFKPALASGHQQWLSGVSLGAWLAASSSSGQEWSALRDSSPYVYAAM